MNARKLIAMVLLLSLPLMAAPRRDPLTSAEIDQMRDLAQLPEKRIVLMVKFARSRMLAIDHLRSDPKFSAERGQRIHELLGDFASIVRELDRNVDAYAGQHWDIRKGLRAAIEATSEFQVKLRSIKETAAAGGDAAKEAAEYQYVLEDAVDAVEANAENARQTLEEQNADAKAKKLKKPQ